MGPMALDKCAREPIRSLSTIEAFKRLAGRSKAWRPAKRQAPDRGCSYHGFPPKLEPKQR